MTLPPNHMQRTPRERRGCNRRVSWRLHARFPFNPAGFGWRGFVK